VLTDGRFFSGSDADLVAVRGRIAAPVLRKDFTITTYQIYEARALGADAVLLIVSLLTDSLIETFLDTATSLGMDALVEVHSEDEARRAARLGATIIGINNRDLATFTVDLGTTERIRPLLPTSATIVAESGILSRADVERVKAAGAHAALVGEALVTAADPAARVRELLGRAVAWPADLPATADRSRA
jgi:indole-3-glycerol phosphate synthase